MKQHHLVFSVTRNHWKWKDIERRIKIHPELARFNHQPVLKEFSDLQLEVPTWERTQILNLLEKKHTGTVKNYYADFAESPFAEEFVDLLNDSFKAEAERYGYHSNWYSTFDGLTPVCYMMTKDDDHVPELALPFQTRQSKTSAPSNSDTDNKQVDQLEQEASEHRYHLALQRASNQQSEAVENEDDEETQLEKKMNKAKLHPSVQPPIMPQPPLTPQPTKKSEKKHKNKDKGLAFGE